MRIITPFKIILMNKSKVLAVLILFTQFPMLAQEDGFRFSGYLDTYYAYDFGKPANHQKQYVTQAARHNEFNINLALIKATYTSDRIRGNLALQTGTYPSVNYAEPTPLAQMINEANVGFRLGRSIWIDAGVMGGHFGYESVFTMDNEVYTQALATEYTPYFQTGIQVTAQVTEDLSVKAVVLNGWQNIYETNDAKALGLGVNYNVSENLTVSYGNFLGDEGNDIVGKKVRFHNNAYASYVLGELKTTLVVDLTRQELFNSTANGSTFFLTWVNGYRFTDLFSAGFRYEYVSDPDEILFSTIAPGFHTNIVTLSGNYSPFENLVVKIEAKSYFGKEDIWTSGPDIGNSTFMINTGIAIRFE